MGFSMLREKANPQTSLTNLHYRILYTVDMDTSVHHDPRDQSGDDLVAYEDRHDSTGIANDAVSLRLEFGSQIVVVLCDFSSSFHPLRVSKDVQLGQRSGCLGWIDSGGVSVCVSEVT